MKHCFILLIITILILLTSCDAIDTNIPANTNTIPNIITTEGDIVIETTFPKDIAATNFEEPTIETTSAKEEAKGVQIGGRITENTKEGKSAMEELYSTEEIIEIFEKERETFENIKNLYLERYLERCDELYYELYIMRKADPNNPTKSALLFTIWEEDENGNDINYPIEELEGYETIIDFLIKYNIGSINGYINGTDDDVIIINVKSTSGTIHQYIIYSVRDHYSNPENDETRGIKLDDNWFYQLFFGV